MDNQSLINYFFLYFSLALLVFLGLVGGVSIIRQYTMRKLAKELGLSYTYRKFTKTEKISNLIFGNYKGREIKIYDAHRLIPIENVSGGGAISRFNPTFFEVIILLTLSFLKLNEHYKITERPYKKTVIEIGPEIHQFIYFKSLLFLPALKIKEELNKLRLNNS